MIMIIIPCIDLAWRSTNEGDGLVPGPEREREDALGVGRLVIVGSKQVIESDMPELVQKVLDVRTCVVCVRSN